MRYFRRSCAAAVVWVALAAVVVVLDVGSASGQEEPFDPGTGTATAQTIKVNPRQGGLSVGITYGLSLAGHQNTGANGDSRAIDLGVIGTLLAGEGCDGGDPTLPAEQQPQPVRVSSADEGAAEGRSSEEIPTTNQFARATDAPLGEAITRTLPIEIPGLLEIGPATATTSSGIVADGVREAKAVVEYGRIALGGNAVVISGLRWEATHRTGAEEDVSGEFSIDALRVLGLPIPVGDVTAALGQVNEVLRTVGLEVALPEVRVVEGVVFVDPLRVAVIPADLRDDLLAPVFQLLQPIREDLFGQLLELDCGTATYITVADVAIGTLSASGSVSLELGGVQASTTEIDGFAFPAEAPPPPPPPPPPSAPAPTQPSTTSPTTTSSTAPTTTETTIERASSGPDDERALPAVGTSDERGGLMAAVAVGGLLLIAALAEADRRKMQRALRVTPVGVA